MARYFKPKKTEAPQEPEHDGFVHGLNIPDALLDWGRDPQVTKRWADKHVVATIDSLLAKGEPLEPPETEKLLACLEALVGAAVRAARVDLLMELDLATAEWLDLRFTATRPDGTKIVIANDGDYTHREMRVILDSEDPKAAAALADRAKALLAEAGFAEDGPVRISDTAPEQDQVCAACGEPLGSVMLCLEGGACWCTDCYRSLTAPLPEHLRKIMNSAPKAKSK